MKTALIDSTTYNAAAGGQPIALKDATGNTLTYDSAGTVYKDAKVVTPWTGGVGNPGVGTQGIAGGDFGDGDFSIGSPSGKGGTAYFFREASAPASIPAGAFVAVAWQE